MTLANDVPAMAAFRSPVLRYYEAIDAGDYDSLAELLTPAFSQIREDRTIEGRDRFVKFMRDERPETDTTHEVDMVYGCREPTEIRAEVAVRGRLRRANGSVGFGFIDVFELDGERLDQLVTYSNRRVD